MDITKEQPKGYVAGLIGSLISLFAFLILMYAVPNFANFIPSDYFNRQNLLYIQFFSTYLAVFIATYYLLKQSNLRKEKLYPPIYYKHLIISMVIGHVLVAGVLIIIIAYSLKGFSSGI